MDAKYSHIMHFIMYLSVQLCRLQLYFKKDIIKDIILFE